MDLQQSLFALSRAVGPSGIEGPAVQTARELLAPLVDETAVDAMGNLTGLRRGSGTGRRILLDAHLDEVSLVVTGQKEGYLSFACLGIDARLLPALTVSVLTQPPMPGVITCLPPHVLTAEEREQPFDVEKLYIDCGLTEEQAKAVPIGTRVAYDTEPVMLRNGAVSGKSLDNRAGFAVLLRTMELLRDKPLPVDVVVLGSVQEEFSGLGARTGAFAQMPDAALVVDVTFASQPDAPKSGTFALGSGPAIGVGPELHRRISDKLRALAPEASVEVLPGSTGTNATEMQTAREGIPTGLVSLPQRYMHTPVEVVRLDDIDACTRLIADWILSLGEEDAQ